MRPKTYDEFAGEITTARVTPAFQGVIECEAVPFADSKPKPALPRSVMPVLA
jgi:hypothetical protein